MTTARLTAVPADVSAYGDEPATFDGVVYDGGIVAAAMIPKSQYPIVFDLQGMKARWRVRAVLDGDETKRLGSIIAVDNDGRRLSVVASLNAATKHRDMVVQSARDGYTWDVSVACDIRSTRLVPAGEYVNLNGRQFSGPLFIVAKSKLRYISFG